MLWGASAMAAEDDEDDDSSGAEVETVGQKTAGNANRHAESGSPAKIGLVHDTLRRAKKQPTGFEKISSEYADFRTRMEDEYGLTWSFSLSYRQRWVRPDDFGTASQTLFWPTVNWEILTARPTAPGRSSFFITASV